jgi:hypothetical protein
VKDANPPLSRFERSLFSFDRTMKKCAGSRKPSKRFKKLPRLSWSICSKIPTSAPFTPNELPSCKRISSLLGEYVAYGVALVGYSEGFYMWSLSCFCMEFLLAAGCLVLFGMRPSSTSGGSRD